MSSQRMATPSPPKGCLDTLLEAAAVADAAKGLLKAAMDPDVMKWLSKTPGRAPNDDEKRKGVPANFCVKEVPRKEGSRVDKYFYAPDGTCFRSIVAIVRWRQAKSASDTDSAASRPATPPTRNPVFRVFTNE